MRKVFIDGPITPQFISDAISKHTSKTNIGAHSIFLGQIRADNIGGNIVTGIEYEAYDKMAEKILEEIREECFEKFDVICMHIYHSIGLVKVGEISLFVFVSSKHRKTSFEACEWIVEEIKKRVPIFGKELFQNNEYQWKKNTPNE